MNEFELLPSSLRKLSLSKSEVVLPYAEALQAIDIFEHADLALHGWEGWVEYTADSHGHHQDYQGTMSIEILPQEKWSDFVKRSAEFCRSTMKIDQERFDVDPICRNMKLYFCLSVFGPEAGG